MTDEPLQNCPKCNGKIKRLIGSGAAPIFKGSGFYQTDYKNSSKSEKPKNSEKTETPKSSTTTETKSEKKA
jgi:predicted nucleic acid-binding Zn ribbon protein